MLIQTTHTTFDLHFSGRFARPGLFIRIGALSMSWDSNGLCFCRGLKTVWANWE
jgi:hypothetical protein